MKKFNSLYELNVYVNSNPIDINDIDIDSLTVKITSKMTTFGVMSTEKEYLCYIIFNDKSSYREYKEGKQIDADLHSINAIQINITLSEFQTLKPKVKYIEFINPDEKLTPSGSFSEDVPVNPYSNWGADIANINLAWTRGFTGKGVRVAIIDDSFPNESNPLNFKDRVTFDTSIIINPTTISIPEGNIATHGTACAGIIGAPAHPERAIGIAYDCDMYGLGTDLRNIAINKAYQWCIDNDIDIVSTSYGYSSSTEITGIRADKLLIEAMQSKGIIHVSSAGNKNSVKHHYPSNYPGVISVGAVAEIGGKLTKVSWDSTTPEGGGYNQPSVDFIFSGQGVRTFDATESPFVSFGGTSAACPGIAGIYAILKQEYPDKSKDELTSLLKSNSFQVMGRYGRYPIYKDYSKKELDGTRISKINKDGSMYIKGEMIVDELCESLKFDSAGNLHVKSFDTGVSSNKYTHPLKFFKDRISTRFIIENQKI